MTTPIPLTDPDGTARAWACGTCGQIDAIENGARTCCRDCLVCLGRLCLADDTICSYCCAVGRRAFEVLAAIGMAVAVEEISSAVRAVCEARTCTAREAAEEWARESLAALCGVGVETVRRWRS